MIFKQATKIIRQKKTLVINTDDTWWLDIKENESKEMNVTSFIILKWILLIEFIVNRKHVLDIKPRIPDIIKLHTTNRSKKWRYNLLFLFSSTSIVTHYYIYCWNTKCINNLILIDDVSLMWCRSISVHFLYLRSHLLKYSCCTYTVSLAGSTSVARFSLNSRVTLLNH